MLERWLGDEVELDPVEGGDVRVVTDGEERSGHGRGARRGQPHRLHLGAARRRRVPGRAHRAARRDRVAADRGRAPAPAPGRRRPRRPGRSRLTRSPRVPRPWCSPERDDPDRRRLRGARGPDPTPPDRGAREPARERDPARGRPPDQPPGGRQAPRRAARGAARERRARRPRGALLARPEPLGEAAEWIARVGVEWDSRLAELRRALER